MALVPESEDESKMLFWWISAYTQSDTYVMWPCYAPSHDRGWWMNVLILLVYRFADRIVKIYPSNGTGNLVETPKYKVGFLKSHKAESSKKCHDSVCSPHKTPGAF
jgi:hypothetical protein